ncbi:MAG: cache domain-containing protein [Betaproteobacteria bacterium]|nr:cache domain-containing protein [Betaproteobacteria bacterium]
MSRRPTKNAIWQKILFFVAIPFLTILGILLFSIVHSVYESKVGLANRLLVNKTRFDSEQLKFTLDSIRLTLEVEAELLSRVDATRPDARKQAERVIQQTLRNRNIYNAWLAYEANAFDGKDDDDRDSYPGAPSGRFIRSYINDGGTIMVVPDMDENFLGDPQSSSWCAEAMKSKKLHININSEEQALYDYRDGKGLQNVYSITIPLFRNGVLLGCMGADGRFDELFGGPDRKTPVVSMLFSESLHLRAAQDSRNIGKSIDETGLSDLTLVKNALRDKELVFFHNARFGLVGGSAMLSFEPVQLEPFGELTWVVAALPFSSIYESMYLVIVVVTGAMLFFSAMLLASLRYAAQIVADTMRAMSRIADDFNPEDSQPQMQRYQEKNFGRIATSFYQMLTGFRKRIDETNWQQEMLDFHLFLERSLFPGVDLPDFFRHAAHRFISVYQAKGATLRLYGAEDADTVIHYDPVSGFSKGDADLSNWQTVLRAALQNTGRIGMVWRYDVEAGSGNAMTVCVFPLRAAEENLLGGIFLNFDAPLPDEIERHAVFMAEEIAHRLAGQEMSLG